jgi:polyphosphate glucokinase
MPASTTKRTPRPAHPMTLAFDIGGTGLKASIIDGKGRMVHDRERVDTPYPCPPPVLVAQLRALTAQLPEVDRVSIAFPGVVRHGRVLTAPNLSRKKASDTEPDPELAAKWHGFDLGRAVGRAFKKPVRVLNDADLQGLDTVKGKGVEVVITLGTGFGTAVFQDGALGPHLEIAHHPFRKGETYDEQLGDLARKRIGRKKWNDRVAEAIDNLRTLLQFDHLYIGGGNTRHLTLELPRNVTVINPNAGLLGAFELWQSDLPIAEAD